MVFQAIKYILLIASLYRPSIKFIVDKREVPRLVLKGISMENSPGKVLSIVKGLISIVSRSRYRTGQEPNIPDLKSSILEYQPDQPFSNSIVLIPGISISVRHMNLWKLPRKRDTPFLSLYT
jgi:hypothetical protein